MEKIVEFIRRKSHWLCLFFFEILALLLLFNGKVYHSFWRISYSNYIVGSIQKFSSDIQHYFLLEKENEALVRQYALLENRYHSLKQEVEYAKEAGRLPKTFLLQDAAQLSEDDLLIARVISSSTQSGANKLILDKGEEDGVWVDMGVLSPQGVVGVVVSVAAHYSVVLPLINPSMKLSCKLKNTGYFAYLQWNKQGVNKAYLIDFPSYVPLSVGDSIVTSGFSTIFPEGILVGCVAQEEGNPNLRLDNHSQISIEISTSFESLEYVYLLKRRTDLSQDSMQGIKKELKSE